MRTSCVDCFFLSCGPTHGVFILAAKPMPNYSSVSDSALAEHICCPRHLVGEIAEARPTRMKSTGHGKNARGKVFNYAMRSRNGTMLIGGRYAPQSVRNASASGSSFALAATMQQYRYPRHLLPLRPRQLRLASRGTQAIQCQGQAYKRI